MENADVEMGAPLSEELVDRISTLLDALDDLNLNDDTSIEGNYDIISQGSKSPSLRKLISTIIYRLSNYLNNGSPIVSIDADKEALWKETTSTFLNFHSVKGSPYTWSASTFESFEGTQTALEYLVGELQATIMVQSSDLSSKMEAESSQSFNSKLSEEIRSCCSKIGATVQEDNIKSLNNIEKKVKEVLPKLPKDYLGGLILSGSQLNAKEVAKLEEINKILNEEYASRKRLMIKRVDVTLESFLWSQKGEESKAEISSTIEKKRKNLTTECNITVYDAFAAHQERASIVKTSAESVVKDTRSSLTSMIIGDVPDRGGRMDRRSELPKAKLAPQAPQEQRNYGKRGRPNRGGYQKERGGFHGKTGREVENTGSNLIVTVESEDGGGKRGGRVQGGWQSNEGSRGFENNKTGGRGRGGNWSGKRGRGGGKWLEK